MHNAAVPVEAYDMTPIMYDFTATSVPRGLIHDDWYDHPDMQTTTRPEVLPQAWANFWHRHFIERADYEPTAADIARSTLTWRGRFKDVIGNRNVNVFNYYSSGTTENGNPLGDEVFELLNYTPSATDGFEWLKSKGRYSWQKQECYKGRKGTVAFAWAASDVMGWGVEEDTTLPITDEGYRTAPYFQHNPVLILGNDTSVITENRDMLLAYGIPAMTEVVGKTSLTNVVNLNYQWEYLDSLSTLPWARIDAGDNLSNRWLHSDIKDVSYPFTRRLYNDILQKGNLR